jgi:hypothetical protein
MVRVPEYMPALQPLPVMVMLKESEFVVSPYGGPVVSVAVADGPETGVRVAVRADPATSPVREKTLAQVAPATVMVPDSGNWPSELAAAWARVAVKFAVVPDVEVIGPM